MFKFFSVSLAMVAGALVTSAHAGGHGRPAGDDAAVITEWNAIAEGVVPTSAGPVLARNYSMMHIAMFDAVNAIEGGYQAYRVRLPASRFASSEAAAAQAAHDVLVSLQPAGTATYDAALAARLAKIPAGRAQYGVQIGREVAKKVLQWRLNDGWETPQSYTPPALPGLWQPTPPNFPTAAFVQAGDSKPLAVPTPYYFMPRRPPALNSQEYADAVDDIMEIGGVTSAVRTAEQTLQARLWASVGYVTNWGGAWNQVARDLARARKLSIVDSARLFVLLNVSMQDSVHTAQASKFVFQLCARCMPSVVPAKT